MEIYAKDISNLTDARFFAALGASWLEFSLIGLKMSATEYNAMKEWVTGSNWVLALNEIYSKMDEAFILDAEINFFSGVINSKYSQKLNFINTNIRDCFAKINQFPGYEGAWIIEEIDRLTDDQIVQLTNLAVSNRIYLQINNMPEEQVKKILKIIAGLKKF